MPGEHMPEINFNCHPISKGRIQSYRYDYQQIGIEFQQASKCNQRGENIEGMTASS